MNLNQMVLTLMRKGYSEGDARARICQDIILVAISKSELCKNVAIKGGVVMRSITKNIRRTTQDMDIDLIGYSLSDSAIDSFVNEINTIDDFSIRRVGVIRELKQQDYHGKSITIEVSDKFGNCIENKIDLGVHNKLEVYQDEYCFDIAYSENRVSFLVNSIEQMLCEKIRSLLKFGSFSTRYKDIYDIYYFCQKVDPTRFINYMKLYVFDDGTMKEKSMVDVHKRLEKVFSNNAYKMSVDKSDKRWIDEDIDLIFSYILGFVMNCCSN